MAWLRLCALLGLLVAWSVPAVLGRELLHTPPLHKRSTYYCGSELVEMLTMVCGAAGISGSSGKRAPPTHAGGWLQYNTVESWPGDSFRLRSVANRFNLATRRSSERSWMADFQPVPSPNALDSGTRWRRSAGDRFKRGIVEECCYNPCGLHTLRSYCNDD